MKENKKTIAIAVAIMLAVAAIIATMMITNTNEETMEDSVVLYCNQSIAEIAKTDSAYTQAMAAARSFTFEKNGVVSSINPVTFINDGINSTFALNTGEIVSVTIENEEIINVVVNGSAVYATGCPLSLKGRSTGDSGKPQMATGTKAGKKAAKPSPTVEVMDEDGEVEGEIKQEDIFDVTPEDVDVEDRIIVDKPIPSAPVADEVEDEIWDEPVESETLSEQLPEVVEERTEVSEPSVENQQQEVVEAKEVVEVEEKIETTPVVEVENPTNQQIFDGEDEIW